MPRVVDYFGQSLKAALSRRINMVTFANLGSVRLPSLKFVGLRVRKIRRIQCITCLSTTVSQLFERKCKKSPFSRNVAHIFVFPGNATEEITQYVAWMERQFNACKTSRSMYPSIFNSFPVIRTAIAKNRCFHVPQTTFLFPLETPLRISRNMLHGWKDNSMLAKPLAACTYLTSIVSGLYDA